MKRRTFLKLGTGALAGSAPAACGGGGHDGGTVQPDPPSAPVQRPASLPGTPGGPARRRARSPQSAT